jgi:hypothetical protein
MQPSTYFPMSSRKSSEKPTKLKDLLKNSPLLDILNCMQTVCLSMSLPNERQSHMAIGSNFLKVGDGSL